MCYCLLLIIPVENASFLLVICSPSHVSTYNKELCFSNAKAYIICYSDSAQKQLPPCASCCCGLRVPGFTMMNLTFHLVMRYQIVLLPCILDDDPSQSSVFKKLYAYNMFNFLHYIRQVPIFQMMIRGNSCLMFRKLVKAAHCSLFLWKLYIIALQIGNRISGGKHASVVRL